MLAYAYFLAQGLGGAKDLNQARTLYESAHEYGLARAAYLLSELERSYPSAKKKLFGRKLLEAAAKAGDGMAWNTLGVLQELEGQAAKARESYSKALAAGNLLAQQNIHALDQGGRGPQQAQLQQLLILAEDRNAQAFFELGRIYHQGKQAQADFGKAFKYYQAAATLGLPAAKEMVGLILSRAEHSSSEPFDGVWMQSLALHPLLARSQDDKLRARVRNTDPLAGLLLPAGSPGAVLQLLP